MDPSNERNWEEFQVRSDTLELDDEKRFWTLAILPAQCLGLGLLTLSAHPVGIFSLLLQVAIVHIFALALARVCQEKKHYTIPGVVESVFGENWRHVVEGVLIFYTFSTMVIAELLIGTGVTRVLRDSDAGSDYWRVGCLLMIVVATGLISCYTTVTSMGAVSLLSCALCLLSLSAPVLHWPAEFLTVTPVHAISLSLSWQWLFPFLLAEKQHSAESLALGTSCTLGGAFLVVFLTAHTETSGGGTFTAFHCGVFMSLISVSAFSLYVCRFTIKQLIGGVKVFKSPVLFYGLTIMLSLCSGILLTAIPEAILELLTTQVLGFFITTFLCPAALSGSKLLWCGTVIEAVLLALLREDMYRAVN